MWFVAKLPAELFSYEVCLVWWWCSLKLLCLLEACIAVLMVIAALARADANPLVVAHAE